MIRRLRRKFVIINMALVAAVLLIVFGVICVSSYQQQHAQGQGAMRMALMRDAGTPPERFLIGKGEKPPEKPVGLLPVFSVTLDEDGTIYNTDTGHVEVTDELIAQAVESAMAQPEDAGSIPALGMRYMREQKPNGLRIAFLDTSVERAAITRLVLTLGLCGLGGLACFLVISIFLANWALLPVEKAWAQQQQFVADASHELKTPLTVILANLGILQGHGDETVRSQQKWIDNTRVEATRMKKLVDDLLFLAKADAAEAPIEKAVFSLTDVLWRCVLSFEPVAYEHGVTLDSDIAPDVLMVGDEPQIVQLVTGLLDNACKYAGEKGTVMVSLTHTQDKVRISVRNSGEPIPPEDLPHVFERFYRADKARVRTQGGYGLGLSIAAQIAKRHGGKITATSNEQEGTTFVVSMPVYKDKLPQG